MASGRPREAMSIVAKAVLSGNSARKITEKMERKIGQFMRDRRYGTRGAPRNAKKKGAIPERTNRTLSAENLLAMESRCFPALRRLSVLRGGAAAAAAKFAIAIGLRLGLLSQAMKVLAGNPAKIDQLDRAAMLLSMLCLIHCTALPLALALLPALLPKSLDNGGFHLVFAFLLLGVGGIAFVQGFRRHHLFVPVLAGVLGTSFLFIGAFNPGAFLPELGEHVVTVAGTFILLFAHMRNRAAIRHCGHAGH